MKNTKKPKIILMWVTFAVLLAVIAYDAWATRDRDNRETLSEMITRASMRYTMIPFVAGILTGHFWWSQKNIWKGMK